MVLRDADAHITVRGSDWLWAVTAIMMATAIGVVAWGMTRPGEFAQFFRRLMQDLTRFLAFPVGQRAFHWIGAAILFTASTAYFSMASDLGAVPVAVEFVRYRSNLFVSGECISLPVWPVYTYMY